MSGYLGGQLLYLVILEGSNYVWLLRKAVVKPGYLGGKK